MVYFATFGFVFSFLLLLVPNLYRVIRPKGRWTCDILGWHNGSGGNNSFDGCSLHATCSRCGKSVMQDGQGNWF